MQKQICIYKNSDRDYIIYLCNFQRIGFVVCTEITRILKSGSKSIRESIAFVKKNYKNIKLVKKYKNIQAKDEFLVFKFK